MTAKVERGGLGRVERAGRRVISLQSFGVPLADVTDVVEKAVFNGSMSSQ